MPKIPDEMWKCPKCGTGFEEGEGLTGPDYTTEAEYKEAYGKDEEYGDCECGACGWYGPAKKVYDAAQKRANRVPCECCKGTGWVDGQKEGKR